jgi:site-specific DNA-methyltransferase (cytosine-N4-specific)
VSAADWVDRCYLGDCREGMRSMVADGVKVQCVVTSPPYW